MSAWEQWGAKRPANGAASALNGAQDAFQSLLRSSPLSATVTANIPGSDNGAYSLKKMWDSARDITKNAVTGGASSSPASSTTSTASSSAADLESLESGQLRESEGRVGENAEHATSTWPLFKRKSNTENALLPTMSW